MPGVSTFDITPKDSLLFSSSCPFFHSGNGIRFGVNKQTGFAPGFSLISMGSPITPNHVNCDGYFNFIWVAKFPCNSIDLHHQAHFLNSRES